MASHIDLGKKGEGIARQHLENKGYLILKENWRFRHKEVDIICKDGTTLVFVEVKTRSDDYFQKPFEAVENRKQNFLIEAAESFIEDYDDFTEVRFDIISIVQHPNAKPLIEHIIDAFLPGINHT
jgi:putative endonuclease